MSKCNLCKTTLTVGNTSVLLTSCKRCVANLIPAKQVTGIDVLEWLKKQCEHVDSCRLDVDFREGMLHLELHKSYGFGTKDFISATAGLRFTESEEFPYYDDEDVEHDVLKETFDKLNDEVGTIDNNKFEMYPMDEI